MHSTAGKDGGEGAVGEHANEPRHRHGACQLFKHLRTAGQAKPSRAELSWRGQRDTWSTLGQDADMAAAKQCSTSSATQRETEKKRSVAWSTKQKSPLLSPRCVAIASVFVCVCVCRPSCHSLLLLLHSGRHQFEHQIKNKCCLC